MFVIYCLRSFVVSSQNKIQVAKCGVCSHICILRKREENSNEIIKENSYSFFFLAFSYRYWSRLSSYPPARLSLIKSLLLFLMKLEYADNFISEFFFITDMQILILHLDFKSNLLSRLFPRARLTQYKSIVICSETLILTGIIIMIIYNFEGIYF